MTKYNSIPEKLKPFSSHGLDLDYESHSTQAVGECPFCNGDKFYANKKTGLWDCKQCGCKGNTDQFLEQLYAASLEQTDNAAYAALAKERGIPAAALERCKLAASIVTDHWLIPYTNGQGIIKTLGVYNGEKVLATAGKSLSLFLPEIPSKTHTTVWVCEGPWDAMVWRHVLSRVKIQKLKGKRRIVAARNAGESLAATNAVIGLPGASNCHKHVGNHVNGKHVRFLFDHDEAGNKGRESLANLLHANGMALDRLRSIFWPEGTADGFDVRDAFNRHKGDAVKTYAYVESLLGGVDALINDDQSDDDEAGELVTNTFDNIQPDKVYWLWDKRIPLGKITIIQGPAEKGKTFFMLDVMARLSTAATFPDGCRIAAPVESIFFSLEDGAADTIRPRLDKLGADCTKIHSGDYMKTGRERRPFELDANLKQLARWLRDHPHVRLVCFDPILDFLGGKTDSNKNQAVRRVLTNMVQLAADFNIGIVLITHLAKDAGRSAINRGLGAGAFNQVARATWFIGENPRNPDESVLARVKGNLAGKVPSLAFSINDGGISWKGEVDVSAEELEREAPAKGPARLDAAKEWLTAFLDGESKGKPSTEIFKAGLQAGFPEITLKRAKQMLKIKTSKAGGNWTWTLTELPDGWKRSDEDIRRTMRKMVKQSAGKRIKSP